MTVRVTTLKGLGAGRYYVEQLPSYYLDANEPRGRWVGIAAHELALSGELPRSGEVGRLSGPTGHRIITVRDEVGIHRGTSRQFARRCDARTSKDLHGVLSAFGCSSRSRR